MTKMDDNAFKMIDQIVTGKKNPHQKLILAGVISAAHGIAGNVVIRSFTSPLENLAKLPLFDGSVKPIKIKLLKTHKTGEIICKIEGCNNRNEAEALVKTKLYCLRSDLPEIDDTDEFYIEDLKGLKLITHEGENENEIGVIVNIFDFGGGAIAEVKLIGNNKLLMLPFSKEIFPKITKNYAVCLLTPEIIKNYQS